MRILHISGTFLPVKGGGPYYVHYLSQHLERAGHTCRVVTTDAGGDPQTETVPTDRSPSVSFAGAPIAPTFPLRLRRVINSFDPDVIHANYPLPFYPDIAAVLAKMGDLPLVLTCHGAFEMSLDSLVGVVGTLYNNSLLRGTLRAADQLHVSNQGILEAFGFYRHHRSKTSVIPIGVDTEWYNPQIVSGPPPYQTSDGTKTVLSVGTFRRYKGFDDLVRAFAQIIEERDAQLVLIGDGPQHEQLVGLVDDYGLGERVQFIGHVTDEELRRAYAHADAFALPSPTIRESLGMVAMEAMAMAVPTVATAASGIGHILSETDAGIVVNPNAPEALAAALRDLLADDATASEQATAGRHLAESRFAWTSVIDDYIGMYERVR